jgi:hypothetical protein
MKTLEALWLMTWPEYGWHVEWVVDHTSAMVFLAPLKKLHCLASPRDTFPNPAEAPPMGCCYRYRVILEILVFGEEELTDDRAEEPSESGRG